MFSPSSTTPSIPKANPTPLATHHRHSSGSNSLKFRFKFISYNYLSLEEAFSNLFRTSLVANDGHTVMQRYFVFLSYAVCCVSKAVGQRENAGTDADEDPFLHQRVIHRQKGHLGAKRRRKTSKQDPSGEMDQINRIGLLKRRWGGGLVSCET